MPGADLHISTIYRTALVFFSIHSQSTLTSTELTVPRGRYTNRGGSTERSSRGSPEAHWRPEKPDKSPPSSRADLDSPPAKELARLRSELQLLREKHRALEATLHDTRHTLSQRDIQLQQLREDHRNLEANYHGVRQIAEERLLEVKSLEKFLTKTDMWSGAQVVQTVRDLNSEILQFAAAASEAFTLDRRKSQESPARNQSLERVASRLGPVMSRILSTRDHSQDPTLLQLALQASISQCVGLALSSFCVGFPAKFDSLLSKIYLHMHAREPQATSSRWRALTHSHIRSLTPTIDEYAIKEITDANLKEAGHILAASGYGDVNRQIDSLRTRFMMQIRHIAETAYRIALVVREGTMSTDFQVDFVDHARTFNPDTMENVFSGYGPSRGPVLCTTELGLRCFTHRELETGSAGHADGVVDKLVILKPKVVLETVIQDFETQ